MLGAIETERAIAEWRVDEGAMVGSFGIGIDVRSEVRATGAHPRNGNLTTILQCDDDLDEGAVKRRLLLCCQRIDRGEQEVAPIGRAVRLAFALIRQSDGPGSGVIRGL